MKTTRVGWAVLAAFLWVVGDGCDSGGGGTGGSPGTAGIDISGSWSGAYVAPGIEIPLTAKIRQSGDAVIIKTSKDGVGNLLTGSMNAEGHLTLVDAYDGETWTSFGPVSEHYIRIRDYLYRPKPGEDEPPEQDIILHR
jgi:hypothetical protein